MFGWGKDRKEISRLKSAIETTLDEFDKANALIKTIVEVNRKRSEERYLVILFGFASAWGQIHDAREENVVAALQQLMRDDQAYKRMVSLIQKPEYEFWRERAEQAVVKVFNSNGHNGPILTLSEEYLST